MPYLKRAAAWPGGLMLAFLMLVVLAMGQPARAMGVQAPGGFFPAWGICFGALGTDGTCVDADHPLPVIFAGASDASAANQVLANTKLDTLHADFGAPGATVCATDTGSCTLNAQIQRALQRLTTINTTLGSPFQAGGGLGASESHLGEVGSKTIIASATFTTPAGTTAYASGDLISNSGTAGSVTPMSFTVCRVATGTGMVRRARIKTPDTGFVSGAVRLHLFKDSPTLTNGDNGVFLATESNYLGALDVTLDRHFSDNEKGIGAPVTGSEINFDCATATQVIYGLLEARGAITPQGSKLFTVVLETLAN